jgi:hypothetical protein
MKNILLNDLRYIGYLLVRKLGNFMKRSLTDVSIIMLLKTHSDVEIETGSKPTPSSAMVRRISVEQKKSIYRLIFPPYENTPG